jgi:hypothetical protein
MVTAVFSEMLENCLYHVTMNADPTHIIATIINWIDELVS